MAARALRLELAVLLAILAFHAWALSLYFVPVLAGTDQNSYHVAARELAQHGRFHLGERSELEFVGGMMVVNARGEYYPKYPPVYPALAGVALALFGDPAGLLVNPLCALLAVAGTYAACRAVLPGWAALVGAWAVAVTPTLNGLAVNQVSHPSSVALCTIGFALFLWAEWRPGAVPRRAGLLLFGAGLALGLAAGVRMPNVLLAPAPTLWLLWRRAPRRLAAWLAGLLGPYAALLLYDWRAFGHPLRTAYSLTDEQSAFAATYFLRGVRIYLPGLVTEIVGPLFLLAAVGFVAVWLRDRRRALFYTLWMLPLALVYCAYYFLPEGHPLSYSRFLLPLVLPSLLLALGIARELARVLPARLGVALVAVLVLAQTAWGVQRSLGHMEMRYSFCELQQRRLELVREHVPPGSTIFATRLLLDDLDYEGDYTLYVNELLSQPDLARVRRRTHERAHDQRGRQAELDRLVALEPDEYRARVRELIEARERAGSEVYLVGSAKVEGLFEETFGGELGLELVASLPEAQPRQVLFRPRREAGTAVPVWRETRIARVVPAGD